MRVSCYPAISNFFRFTGFMDFLGRRNDFTFMVKITIFNQKTVNLRLPDKKVSNPISNCRINNFIDIYSFRICLFIINVEHLQLFKCFRFVRIIFDLPQNHMVLASDLILFAGIIKVCHYFWFCVDDLKLFRDYIKGEMFSGRFLLENKQLKVFGDWCVVANYNFLRRQGIY
eukprot:TRINITY_DN30111_c0_g1_i1.p1 TRINITY_DN30111_c0_g1~~TRINITY_DN30111_c0_g1_i1.p1  ORF type:complete len:172 (-),score=1.30 TRINITY_DN30111_c0_g1_i1:130-645(-)